MLKRNGFILNITNYDKSCISFVVKLQHVLNYNIMHNA